jgi:hypothetical protein
MFQHLLITRFNLKNPDWKFTKNNDTLLDDQWMKDRMELFQNYCLPSVVSQTNKNFKWLLFFDSSTSDFFKNEIQKTVLDYSNILIFYINGMPEFDSSILKYVSENTKDKPYLITSRIDNDDCIHIDFINEVQQKFNNQNFMAFDFIKGYTLQVEPKIMLGKKEHIFNPFISLIEKNENPKTVWHYVHNMWKKEPRVTQVTDKRIWMSIIHKKNKVNKFDGYGNVDWSSINKEFMLSEKMNETISSTIIPFRKWWFRSLRNFIYVKRVLLSKKIKKAIGVYKVR